jgi:hypothetical protein
MRFPSRRTSAKSGGPHRRAGEATAAVVEHFAYLDAVGEELVAGRVYVVHRQDHAVDRTRLSGGDPLMIEHAEPGGVSCTTRKPSPTTWSMGAASHARRSPAG